MHGIQILLQRQGWLLAMGMAMVPMALLEHRFGLQSHGLTLFCFSVFPLIFGIFCLKPGQELLLGALFLGSPLLLSSVFSVGGIEGEVLLQSLHRVLLVGLCVWLSRQRLRLTRQAVELKQQLVISLQAAAVAHEIRQPLTLVQLESRRLLRYLEQQETPDAVARQGLEAIHESSQKLGQTVHAIAGLLRREIDAHRSVDFNAVFLSALQEQQLRLSRIGQCLCVEGLGHSTLLIGDAEQLRIAVSNLLCNALDALEMLEPSRRQMRVSLRRKGDRLALVVADSGPGLPPDLMARRMGRSAKPSGMGLGLMLVQAIAAAHNGELMLGSCPELGGAKLSLIFPVAH